MDWGSLTLRQKLTPFLVLEFTFCCKFLIKILGVMAAKTKTMSTFKQILLLFHQGKKIKSLPEIALFL
jgi:hypothetical protein